ncbi:MAG: acetylornithine deacetylase [Alphaproteobacteria bacterium]|nr:MAG: acetylornithine deacetylase [Alphaproteobacteria bacterium]
MYEHEHERKCLSEGGERLHEGHGRPPGVAPASLDWIERLVRFPTVSSESNLDLIAAVEAHLTGLGFSCRRFQNEAGDKANLLASIGPPERAGVMLSGHTDVVPVEGQAWSHDPFDPWWVDDRLHGRGTADMKGFLGLLLGLAPEMAARPLTMPIHLAFSYDEEVGCAGVRSLVRHLAALETKPRFALVGEPTGMRVVDAHKGIRVIRTLVRGRPGHSSAPARGINAIAIAARMIAFLAEEAARIASRENDARFDPPHTTINVGRIEGGSAVNIIAEHAVFEWEFRPLPGSDPDAPLKALRRFAEQELPRLPGLNAEKAEIRFEEVAAAPALDAGPNAQAERLIMKLLGANRTEAVAFTTEAGLFQHVAGVPAIVCGPGEIEQAHQPDEFVALDQLARSERLLRRLIGLARKDSDGV